MNIRTKRKEKVAQRLKVSVAELNRLQRDASAQKLGYENHSKYSLDCKARQWGHADYAAYQEHVEQKRIEKIRSKITTYWGRKSAEYIEASGLSIAAFAQHMDINQGSITRIIYGQRPFPEFIKVKLITELEQMKYVIQKGETLDSKLELK